MSNFRRVKWNSIQTIDTELSDLIIYYLKLHLTRRKFDIRATYKQELIDVHGNAMQIESSVCLYKLSHLYVSTYKKVSIKNIIIFTPVQ